MEQHRNIRATLSATTLLCLFILLAIGAYLKTKDLVLVAELLVWSHLLFTACLQVVIAWSFLRDSEVFLEHTDQDTAGKILVFGLIPLIAAAFLYLAWSGAHLMLLGIVLLVLQFRETWQDEVKEVKARGLSGAICLLNFVILAATGMSGLDLIILSVLSYQAVLTLSAWQHAVVADATTQLP
jgi:hypothetical protein